MFKYFSEKLLLLAAFFNQIIFDVLSVEGKATSYLLHAQTEEILFATENFTYESKNTKRTDILSCKYVIIKEVIS